MNSTQIDSGRKLRKIKCTLVLWYIVALSRYLYGLDFGQELAQNRAHINSVFSCTGTFLIFLEFDASIFFGSSLLFGTFGHFLYFGTFWHFGTLIKKGPKTPSFWKFRAKINPLSLIPTVSRSECYAHHVGT